MPLRYRIVSSTTSTTYAGMDRPLLGMRDDVPRELVMRSFTLEELFPERIEAGHRRILLELRERGLSGYELLRLGGTSDAEWELLGFDVGETTSRAWSAIVHHADFALPVPHLNDYGLFDDRAEAEQFLRTYLECDDPDGGWTERGWEDRPDLYAVVPIHRLRS